MRVDDAADGIELPSSRERIHDGHGVGWITSLCGGWTRYKSEKTGSNKRAAAEQLAILQSRVAVCFRLFGSHVNRGSVVSVHPVIAFPQTVLGPLALHIGLGRQGISKQRIVEAFGVVGRTDHDARRAFVPRRFISAECRC